MLHYLQALCAVCLHFHLIVHELVCIFYRGSALQKRLRDREKEMEADERDRKREKEELEEIRQRLLAEGHPDPDAELQRVTSEPSFCQTSSN